VTISGDRYEINCSLFSGTGI